MKLIKNILIPLLLAVVLITCSGGGGEGSGTTSDGNSGNPTPFSFGTVGGNVVGLSNNDQVILQLNGKDDSEHLVTIKKDMSFAFKKNLKDKEDYLVLVKSATGTTCMAYDNFGKINAANVTNVQVVCSDTVYTLHIDVIGLRTNSTAVFQNNGQDDLTATESKKYSFSKKVPAGAKYNVLTKVNPEGAHEQICTPSTSSATMSQDTTVTVNCKIGYFKIKGSYVGLNSDNMKIALKVDSYGKTYQEELVFSNPLPNAPSSQVNFTFGEYRSWSDYEVSASSDKNLRQECTVENSKGRIWGENVENIKITCVPMTAILEGTVTYLADNEEIVLTLNGANDETVSKPAPYSSNYNITFSWKLKDGDNYSIAVKKHPPGKTCIVKNGTGKLLWPNWPYTSDIKVTCTYNKYTISGTVNGLCPNQKIKLKLTQGYKSYFTNVTGNNYFSFPPQDDLSDYRVTVESEPHETSCTVKNSAGRLAGANVQTEVTCTNCASCAGTTNKSVTVRWDPSRATLVNETGGGHKVYWSTKSFDSSRETGVTEITVPYTKNSTEIKGLPQNCKIWVRVRPYSSRNPNIYNKNTNPLGSRLSQQYFVITK